jgi:hypothetical protein
MPMSDYLENQLIDHLFRTATFAKPSAVYIGLYTAAPSDAGGGTEVAGGSYARQNLAPLNANWNATQGGTTGASSGTSGATANASAITFPVPSADWGVITHYGLFDGLTGNLLFWGAFTVAKTVSNGDQAPVIAIGGMTVTFS